MTRYRVFGQLSFNLEAKSPAHAEAEILDLLERFQTLIGQQAEGPTITMFQPTRLEVRDALEEQHQR